MEIGLRGRPKAGISSLYPIELFRRRLVLKQMATCSISLMGFYLACIHTQISIIGNIFFAGLDAVFVMGLS